jgi:ubiquinone/menaquinone biosynthesis C-methylase UbiE
MANWYQKYVVPRFLDRSMGSIKFDSLRAAALADVSGTVLEIGVGPGHNFPYYRNVTKVYALEPSQELIDIARPRTKTLSFPVEFLCCGAEHIPLPDGSVDTVVSTWTLCSVADPVQVLQEIARVLRPNGRFIFIDHGASPRSNIRTLQMISTSLTKYFTGNCHYDRTIEQLIRATGFSIEKMTHPIEKYRPLIYNYQGVAIKT